MNEYLNHFVAARNIRASAALGELALGTCASELKNSVGRFCLVLHVRGTCFRWSSLVVTP